MKLRDDARTPALSTLSYRGFQAWMTRKKKLEKCRLQDDLVNLLDSIHDAKASPIIAGFLC